MPLYFQRALGFAALMAWFGAFCAEDCGSRWPYALASAGTLAFLSLRKAITPNFGVTLLLIGGLFFSYALLLNPQPSGNDLSKYNGFNAVIRVQIADDPKSFGRKAFSCTVNPLAMIFPQPGCLDGVAQLIFSKTDAIQFKRGDFVEVKAALKAPESPVEPWKFQTKNYLNRRRIFCVATAEGALFKLPPPARSMLSGLIDEIIAFAAERRQAIFQAHLRYIGARYAPLLQSIVLGDKMTDLPKEIKNDFRRVGLSHVTAASGFNLTVVVGIAYWATAFLAKTGILRQFIPMVAILIFVVMAGPSPSVVRAALCCSTFLLATLLKRKFSPYSVLSLSLLECLALDPILATDVGAELSYAATFGIICLAKDLITKKGDEQKQTIGLQMEGLRVWLIESLAVLFSVQMTVLPIQLIYFWQTGLAFLPANLIVEPVIAPLTVIGFLSSLLAALATGPWAPPLSLLAFWLDQVACLFIKFILAIVEQFSHFPSAVINVGPPHAAQVFTYYLVVLFILHSLKKQKSLLLLGVIYSMALTLLFYRPPLRAPVICVSQEFLGLVGVDRKGFCIGEPEQAEKFFAYYGASAMSIQTAGGQEREFTVPIFNGVCLTSWLISSASRRDQSQAPDKTREPRYFLSFEHLPKLAYVSMGTTAASTSPPVKTEAPDGLHITVVPSFRILHDQRLEGDTNHPFTLFCSRGLTANF